MNIIKCPACGSTAQTKKVSSYSWQLTDLTKGKTDNYVCGCGCFFSAKYKLEKIEVRA